VSEAATGPGLPGLPRWILRDGRDGGRRVSAIAVAGRGYRAGATCGDDARATLDALGPTVRAAGKRGATGRAGITSAVSMSWQQSQLARPKP
jgi:hypothetical protein